MFSATLRISSVCSPLLLLLLKGFLPGFWLPDLPVWMIFIDLDRLAIFVPRQDLNWNACCLAVLRIDFVDVRPILFVEWSRDVGVVIDLC